MRKDVRVFVVGVVLFSAVVVLSDSTAHGGRRVSRKKSVAPATTAPDVVSQSPAEVVPLAATTILDPRQAMADILALRQAQATGDSTADQAFVEALQKLIEEKHGTPPATVAVEPPPFTVPQPARTTPGVVLNLRDSARHFDDRANALENEKAYADADAARQIASQLRAEARRLDP